MKDELDYKIIDLYHLARTALANRPVAPTRYDRMLYVQNALRNHHHNLISHLSSKQLWFRISDALTQE